MNPMGHEQLESCRRDLQMALAPQGSTEHASLQVPSTHLSGSLQSLSVMQEGCGVTKIMLSCQTGQIGEQLLPLALHSPLGPMKVS